MAPVLLDNRGLLKVAISMVLLLVVVFGGGFIIGYQKAVTQQLALTQDRGIELPVVDVTQAESQAMALSPQPPAMEVAGALIDVDEPDNVQNNQQDLAVKTFPEENAPQMVSGENGHSDNNGNIASIIAAATDVITHNKIEIPLSHSQPPLVPDAEDVPIKVVQSKATSAKTTKSGEDEPSRGKLAQTNEMAGNAKKVKTRNTDNAITEVSKLNARYTIQVGMYGSRVNANNLVTMLEAQGLDAYISEFLNKKQQPRYNVRFGYFENKRTALKGLKHYTENMDGNAYLVKLKRTMHAENNRSASSVPTNKTAQF